MTRHEHSADLCFDEKTKKVTVKESGDNSLNNLSPLPTLSAPLKIFLEITNQCNLSCLFCLNNSGTGRHDKLSLEQIKCIMKEASEMKVFEVGLTGGEPLLHPDFAAIVNIIKEYDFPIHINTNACVDEPLLQTLIDARIDHIKVSIDGDIQAHDSIRGEGAFLKTLGNIKKIIAAGQQVKLIFTVCRSNEHSIEKTIELADKLRCHIKMAPMLSAGRGKAIAGKESIPFSEWQGIRQRVDNFIRENNFEAEIASGFLDYCPMDTIRKDTCQKIIDDYCFIFTECGLRSSFLGIGCKGEVFATGRQTDFNNTHKVGDITSETLQKIWQRNVLSNAERFTACGGCAGRDISDIYLKSFRKLYQ